MTKEQVRLLQAEIQADLHNIAEVYAILNALNRDISQEETAIVVAYYLNVLYGLFENLFTRIATLFGNQVEKKSQWRAHYFTA